jgi:hypothetical protein
MKACRESRSVATLSITRRSLFSRDTTPVPIQQEAGGGGLRAPLDAFGKEKKSLTTARIRTLDRPASSPLSIPLRDNNVKEQMYAFFFRETL